MPFPGTRHHRTFRRLAPWQAMEQFEQRALLALNPTVQEQYLLELLNSLRADPAANLRLMTSSLGDQARSNDPQIDSALRFFMTSGTALTRQWASLRAVPPLAWNEDLYEAAEAHTRKMIEVDQQTHQAPGEPDLGDRATNAGYTNFTALAENVYAFAESIFHAHAGFAIDWGTDANGIQDPPGHRVNMMNATYREVGIRVLSENVSSTQVGPLVVTQDFGTRFNFGNPFLLGVTTNDSDRDHRYDPGEGLGGVTIRAVGAAGAFTTTSLDAGGYQLRVPAGLYDVTFSGAAFGSDVTYRNISVGADNVKLDGIRGERPPQPAIAVLGNGIEIVSGDTTPAATDWTDFGSVNLAQTLTRAFTIRNTGQAAMELAGIIRVAVTGSASFSLVSDAAPVVPAGGETTFEIRFDPADTRAAAATVTIRSDDPDTPTYTLRLGGRGVNAPDIEVTGRSAVAILDGDTTPITADGTGFGTVNVSSRARTRTFVLRNTGSTTLSLGGLNSQFVTLSGAAAGDFAVTAQPVDTLSPGALTTFRIRFNPSALGARAATVRIASNVTGKSPFDFVIRGVGIAAPIVQVLGASSVVEPAALPSDATGTNFGSTPTDGGFVVRTFTIANIGSSVLTLAAAKRARVMIDGAAAASFRVSLQPAAALAPGQSTTFRIRFDPLSRGDKLARIVIDTVNGGTFAFNVGGAAA